MIIATLLSVSITPMPVYAKNNNYMYTKETVNIRESPNTSSKIVGKLYWNKRIRVIKKHSKNWYKVKYKREDRYVYSRYLRNSKQKFKTYPSPSESSFKSYEDADCITDSNGLAQGRLKKKYTLSKYGVWTVDGRYCIALGSYYTKQIGVKIDLVLENNKKKHTLKCITADMKDDNDTVNNHRVHSDGSIVEFVVNTSSLPRMARLMGDISYAGKQFKGEIKKIKVYQ